MPRQRHSDYMHFAKWGADARYNLAASGVANCDLADLGVTPDHLALHGPNVDGYAPLRERIAGRFGVPVACVVSPGGGASFVNHLAMAALVEPGDDVLVETPAYGVLADTLAYLQADIRRFERRADEAWRLNPERIVAAIRPSTRLVVLTNLHNPSSAPADEAAVAAIAEAAAQVGAWVLIDEVYRELTFASGEATTSFREAGNIVVTSSLTKAYGVSGLRCGWVLAPAELAQRMRRLNDLFGVHPPHVAERLAVVAFDHLEALRRRALGIVGANLAAYREILGGHPKLDQVIFDAAATVFPRLVDGDGDAFFQRLRSEFDTSLAPGSFFGAADHVRIGLGADPAMTREALARIAEALG